MADIKFSEFLENTSPALTDEVVGLQGGVNKRTTLQRIKDLFIPFDTRFPFGKSGLNIFPHRGVTAFGAPENSLTSLEHAAWIGAKTVELDVNWTSDGQFVLLHDLTLNSQFTLANGDPIVGDVYIQDITLSDAETLYRMASSNEGYRNKITTLDEWLKSCAALGMTPVLEPRSGMPESLDDSLIALTRKYFPDESIVLYSFDYDMVARLAAKANYFPVFTNASDPDIDLAAEYRGGVLMSHGNITPEIMEEAALKNVTVLAYTPNTQEELNNLLELGVMGMTSDLLACQDYELLSLIHSYYSGAAFTGCFVSSGGTPSGYVVTLPTVASYLTSPNINTTIFGSIDGEIEVEGDVNIKIFLSGVEQENIHFPTTTRTLFKINRLINQVGTFSVQIISNQINAKVYTLNIRSLTVEQSSHRSDGGFGINFIPVVGKSIINKGTSIPSLSTWDANNLGARYQFNDGGFVDYIAAVSNASADTVGAFVGMRSRGTSAVPTTVLPGDKVSGLFGKAFTGTSFRTHASVELVVSNTVAAGDAAMAISFQTGLSTRTQKFFMGTMGGFLQGASSGYSADETSLIGYNYRDIKTITGASTSFGHVIEGVIQRSVTVGASLRRTIANTIAGAAYTVPFIEHNGATQGTFGAGTTVTEQWGFRAWDSLIGATSNYGFYGDIPAGTNRWNNYNPGTAQNWFAGKVGIGSGKSVPTYEVDVNGRVDATSFGVNGTIGADGTFTTVDGKTVTVTKGLITNIV